MAEQIIQNQIQALSELITAMKSSVELIDEAREDYHKCVENAIQQGVDRDIMTKFYEEHLQPNLVKLMNVAADIDSTDIPYIQKQIDHLEQTPIT